MAPREVMQRLAQLRAVLEDELGGGSECQVPVTATDELLDALTQAIRAVETKAALREVYEAAKAQHAAEDFEVMPCQHACCAPLDWEAFQAGRLRLYNAIKAVDSI